MLHQMKTYVGRARKNPPEIQMRLCLEEEHFSLVSEEEFGDPDSKVIPNPAWASIDKSLYSWSASLYTMSKVPLFKINDFDENGVPIFDGPASVKTEHLIDSVQVGTWQNPRNHQVPRYKITQKPFKLFGSTGPLVRLPYIEMNILFRIKPKISTSSDTTLIVWGDCTNGRTMTSGQRDGPCGDAFNLIFWHAKSPSTGVLNYFMKYLHERTNFNFRQP